MNNGESIPSLAGDVPWGSANGRRVTVQERRKRSWWEWFFPPATERELQQEQRIKQLEAELKIATLEIDLLETTVERLRRWMLADTAAAVGIARMHGAPDDGYHRK